MTIPLETTTPRALEDHLRSHPVLVLPFGTIEWHSHHLPLGLDGIVAQAMATRMADAMKAVVAPVCYWAVGGVPFPYTLNLPLTEVETLLRTVLLQHSSMGFSVIVLFTGHFGLEQTLAIKRAAVQVMEETSTTILPLTTYDLVADFYSGDHAGIGETSLMMALRPDLVHLDALPASEPLPGVIGDDPRPAANADFGERILRVSVDRATGLVASFRNGLIQREPWIAALSLAVSILDRTRQLRATLPREQVPGPTTTDYLQGCAALAVGDLTTAQERFRAKLDTLHRLV